MNPNNVLLISFSWNPRSCKNKKPKEIIKTTIEYIPVEKEVPQYIPKWIDRVIVDIDTFLVNQKIDTNAILSDYYAKYYFVDGKVLNIFQKHPVDIWLLFN